MRTLLTRLLTGWRALMAKWDAALNDMDDTPTTNGDTNGAPMVVEDDVIWIFTDNGNPDAARMAWLGYVRIPSQQHRQRLDGEARHD